MNKHIFIVALRFIDTINGRDILRSEIVEDVEDKCQAFGAAVFRNILTSDFVLADYHITEHTIGFEEKINADYALSGFLTLIDTAGRIILGNAVCSLAQRNTKIKAIKRLREHLKPWLGLKECKAIIDCWEKQQTSNQPLTPLSKMVRIHLSDNGWDIIS